MLLRKIVFYATVIVTTLIFPIVGIAVTIGYTLFCVARAGFNALMGLSRSPQPTARQRHA